ncbi:MAG: MoaD/ThiS family protein [Dehalococcoidia bacterium]|nr:MoaD/ThiS family protein [Dehalococcoidia bacterium]
MGSDIRIEVRLFGKLRRLARRSEVSAESIVRVKAKAGENILGILDRLGISGAEVSNVFLNGTLVELDEPVGDGDRLGIFPDNMGLLYC